MGKKTFLGLFIGLLSFLCLMISVKLLSIIGVHNCWGWLCITSIMGNFIILGGLAILLALKLEG
jgi:hypothetical protein